jgi:hypothetical protein
LLASFLVFLIIWAKRITYCIPSGTACNRTCGTTDLGPADCSTHGSDTWRNQRSATTANQTASNITNATTDETATDSASSNTRLVRLQTIWIVNADRVA